MMPAKHGAGPLPACLSAMLRLAHRNIRHVALPEKVRPI
jgi:hypothetical protein